MLTNRHKVNISFESKKQLNLIYDYRKILTNYPYIHFSMHLIKITRVLRLMFLRGDLEVNSHRFGFHA